MFEFVLIKTNEEYMAASKLFVQYAAGLSIDLGFQQFDEELLNLKKVYHTNEGGIILCKQNSDFIGCVAIRKLTNEIAELKRMYVQPTHQHKGIGQQLIQEAIMLAQKYTYKYIRLDTLNDMLPAIRLYKKNGFYPIPPYYYNPVTTAVYFELQL